MFDVDEVVDRMYSDEDIIDTMGDDGYEVKTKSKNIDDSDDDSEGKNAVKNEGVKAASGKVSKASLARAIYEDEAKKGPVVRKNVIARFKSEAGLTEAGASTYYAQIHKK